MKKKLTTKSVQLDPEVHERLAERVHTKGCGKATDVIDRLLKLTEGTWDD